MAETYEAPRPKKEDIEKYYETKEALKKALQEHRESIFKFNPKPTLNDGSYEMSLEYAGLFEIDKLLNRY